MAVSIVAEVINLYNELNLECIHKYTASRTACKIKFSLPIPPTSRNVRTGYLAPMNKQIQ